MASPVKPPKQLYQVIKNSIMSAYVEPLIKDGGPIPSDRKLAAEYEVNVGTINKAIHELAREGLVQRRVGSGTRVIPQTITRPAIGIYFGDLVLDGSRETAVYGKLDLAIQELISEAGRGVRHYVDMRIPAFQGEPLPELTDDVKSSRLTSLIVARASPNEYEWLSRLPVPVIGNNVGVSGPSVYYDLRTAASRAAKHLAQDGCKRIALVCPSAPGDGVETPPIWRGVEDALGGTPLMDDAIWADAGAPGSDPSHELRGRAAMENLWRKKNRPDGIIVFTDVYALGLVHSAKELGIAVGKALKVVALTNAENPWPELADIPQMQLSMRKVASSLLDLAVRLERGDQAGDVSIPFTFRAGRSRTKRSR